MAGKSSDESPRLVASREDAVASAPAVQANGLPGSIDDGKEAAQSQEQPPKQKTMQAASTTVYLPMQIQGMKILLEEGSGVWRLTNSELKADAFSVRYRRGKKLDDCQGEFCAEFGDLVKGSDEGDGWLRCQIELSACKSNGSYRVPSTSLGVEDLTGGGVYSGVVNSEGKAHGKGRLKFDNGLLLIGCFANGSIDEGVAYVSEGRSQGEAKYTVSAGRVSSSVDKDLVSKYPSPFKTSAKSSFCSGCDCMLMME